MRLSILGSGDAFSGCGCNAAYLVDRQVLVDCGAPVHALLHRVGATSRDLRLILLTHFHADHSFMIPMLLGGLTLLSDERPPQLVVAGPVGTREYVTRIVAAGFGHHLQQLIDQRSGMEFVVLQDGSDIELAGYRVQAHAVVHSLGPSLAYRLTAADGTSIGFSGDSALCAGLRRCIAGCDCFVCECTGWREPMPGGHLWRGEVEQLIAENPRTRFVVSHLSERRPVPGAIVAHDLLTLEITPG